MASTSHAPTDTMASNSQSLEDFFKSHSECIDPDKVVVLKSPDPTSVVTGARRYLNADHIKWLLKHVLVDCYKYVKEELTGTRVFWVANPEETIKNNSKIIIPLNPSSKKPIKQAATTASPNAATTSNTTTASTTTTKSYADATQPGFCCTLERYSEPAAKSQYNK